MVHQIITEAILGEHSINIAPEIDAWGIAIVSLNLAASLPRSSIGLHTASELLP